MVSPGGVLCHGALQRQTLSQPRGGGGRSAALADCFSGLALHAMAVLRVSVELLASLPPGAMALLAGLL